MRSGSVRHALHLLLGCALTGIAGREGTVAQTPAAEKVDYSLKTALGGDIVPPEAAAGELREAFLGIFSGEPPGDTADLIRRLGAPSPVERELASRTLRSYLESHPASVMPLVEAGLKSGDLEVRMRCRGLMTGWVAPNLDGLLERVMMERTPGFLGILEKVPDPYWEGHRRWRLPDIIGGIAREEDSDLLRGWLGHRRPVFRLAAARALGKLGDGDSLKALVSDPEPLVRLEVALQWGKLSDARCVSLLRGLVSDENFLVRGVSAYALGQISGAFLGFPGTASPEKLKDIVEGWRIQEIPKPRFPLVLPMSRLSNAPTGSHLFILPAGPTAVGKYDRKGNLVQSWDVPFDDQASDMIPMEGGRILFGGNSLKGEYSWKIVDEKGTVLRDNARAGYPCPSLLSNGHLLLCEATKVVEIDGAGEEILQIPVSSGRGRNAWRARYGTTLVAGSRDVSEFDRKGEPVWRYDFETDFVTCCQGLPNGNILVVLRSSNRVIEMTHEKEVVWEWKSDKGTVRDCFMLPSNTLLVATDQGAKEVNRDGRTLWEILGDGIWQVRRGE